MVAKQKAMPGQLKPNDERGFFMLSGAIEKLASGKSLGQFEMAEVVDRIMQGKCSDDQIAKLLTLLFAKGETVDELAGAASAMRSHMKTIRCERENAVDTCGTGGSGKGTFNISTAAAFVAAACGVTVAKHGNRKATSNSGSTDVLAELGIAVDRSIEDAERCLNEAGLCFCHAPLFHPSVKHVIEVRRQLDHPTIFNLLGPLCNPASAPCQVLGAGRGETQELIAQALSRLGTKHSVVIHGADGLGEITCGDETRVFEIKEGEVAVHEWSPEQFGLTRTSADQLTAADPQQSAETIRRVLAGEQGSARDIVVMNAAAAVWISGVANNLKEAAFRCQSAIDEGLAMSKLKQMQKLTNHAF
jgi:anthranilate phosphoribosyltransferase